MQGASAGTDEVAKTADDVVADFRKHAQEFLDVTRKTMEDMLRSYEYKFNDLQRGHGTLIEQARTKTKEANAKLVDMFAQDYEKLRTSLREDFAEVSTHTRNQFTQTKDRFLSTLVNAFQNYTNKMDKLTTDATKQLDEFFTHHSQHFDQDFENFMKKLHSAYEESVKKLKELDTIVIEEGPAPATSASTAAAAPK